MELDDAVLAALDDDPFSRTGASPVATELDPCGTSGKRFMSEV